jgi:CheY-like chemotaxis protein
VDDAWDAAAELLSADTFFVTFLEVMENSAAVLQKLKKKNARLPVVMIDTDADLRRRHSLLQMGADLHLTKPAPKRMHPSGAEEELDLFADELVLFADRVFAQSDAGSDIHRAFKLLKQLINELSDPNDIHEVGETILHLAAEYLERGALFVVGDREFVGLGGFGTDVSNLTLPRQDDSILGEVASSGTARRGKLRRTPANVELIERLGKLAPTEVVALPIMQGGRTIGILYGDNAEHRVPIDSTAGLEIFLSQAGFALEKAIAAAERSDRG